MDISSSASVASLPNKTRAVATRWSKNKLILVLVGGAMAITGQLAQAEIDKPLPERVNCIARNEEIILEVRTDPALIPLLRRQHDGLDATCGQATEIAQTLAADRPHQSRRQPTPGAACSPRRRGQTSARLNARQ
jgi:hypothetical protein